MAKRIDDSRVIELAARGWSASRIAQELGEHYRTILRRLYKLDPQIRTRRKELVDGTHSAVVQVGQPAPAPESPGMPAALEAAARPRASSVRPRAPSAKRVRLDAPGPVEVTAPALGTGGVGGGGEELPDALEAGEVSPEALPDMVPEIDTLAEVDHWLRLARKRAREAEATGDLVALGTFMRLANQLMDQRRKLSPPPKVSVDDQPDMVAAAQRCRERLHKLIETAVLAGKGGTGEG